VRGGVWGELFSDSGVGVAVLHSGAGDSNSEFNIGLEIGTKRVWFQDHCTEGRVVPIVNSILDSSGGGFMPSGWCPEARGGGREY